MQQKPPPSPQAQLHWQTTQTKIRPLTQWQITGKLGIKTSKESHGVLLNWAQQEQLYHLQLTSPLGKAVAQIKGDARSVILQLSETEVYQSTSLENLLWERLGWTFPADHLFYWVRGLPAPEGNFDYTLNEQDLLANLMQDNWEITYHQYQNVADVALPSKIILKNPQLTLTLLIKKWQLPNTP